MIRQAFVKEINDSINKTPYFADHDFDIRSSDRSGDANLIIQYRYDPQYAINVVINKRANAEGEFAVSGSASPGEMAQTEQFTLFGRGAFLGYLSKWLDRLKGELDAIPLNRRLDDQRREIDAIYEQFGEIKSEYFSRDEADRLKSKLDELEQHLKSRISETVQNAAAADKRHAELTNEFEELKKSVDSLKKPGWFRSFSTYVASWMKDPNNRAMLKDGTEIVKGFLE